MCGRNRPTRPNLSPRPIYGELLEPVKEQGDWTLCRMSDRYLGWVRNWHLAPMSRADHDRYRSAADHRVAANHALVFAGPTEEALPVTDLVIGTCLKIDTCKQKGWSAAELPDGKAGFIRSASVEVTPAPGPPDRDHLAATGMRFLGIPYVWGGTTPKGFDCSGLIQCIFRLNGIELPRDSDLQATVGRMLPAQRPEALQTGDLLFFGRAADRITHVAMMLSDGLFLHAHGQVRVGSVDPAHGLYEPDILKIWLHSRDPLVA